MSEATGVVKPSTPRSFLFGMRGEAEVDKLQVGELTAIKLPVIVLDHPVLKALEDMTGRKLDGLMGFTFFARYKTTIDYHAHKMTFEPIEYQVRDLLKELPDRLMGPKVTRQKMLAPWACGVCGWESRPAVLIRPACQLSRFMVGPRPPGPVLSRVTC